MSHDRQSRSPQKPQWVSFVTPWLPHTLTARGLSVRAHKISCCEVAASKAASETSLLCIWRSVQLGNCSCNIGLAKSRFIFYYLGAASHRQGIPSVFRGRLCDSRPCVPSKANWSVTLVLGLGAENELHSRLKSASFIWTFFLSFWFLLTCRWKLIFFQLSLLNLYPFASRVWT